MELQYNISQLFSLIWNYRGLPYPQGAEFAGIVNGVKSLFKKTEDFAPKQWGDGQNYSKLGTAISKTDWLGRSVFLPVTFSIPNATAQQRKIYNTNDGFDMPNAIMAINCRKNIIITPMAGRKGTVKETISIDDYMIDLLAIIVPTGYDHNEWPEETIMKVKELFEVNAAIKMKCALSDIFLSDEDNVVITEINFPSHPAVKNAVPVELKLISDKVFELELT